MKITVLVKQIQLTEGARFNPDYSIDRTRGNRQLNPADHRAMQMAAQLKKECAGFVECVSMGPRSAETILHECASMDADHLVLVSDAAYAASDTFATSYILSGAIRYLGMPDLVLCGRRAVDGETGQIGPQVAARLGMSCVANIREIVALHPESVIVRCTTERAEQLLEVALPAVLCVCEDRIVEMIPTLEQLRRARKLTVEYLDNRALGLPAEKIGKQGSKTRVTDVTFQEFSMRNGEMAADPRAFAERVRLLCGGQA